MALGVLVRCRSRRTLSLDCGESTLHRRFGSGALETQSGACHGTYPRPDRPGVSIGHHRPGAATSAPAGLAGFGTWEHSGSRCIPATGAARLCCDSHFSRFFRQAPHHAGRSHTTLGTSMIRFETSLGDFTIELLEKEAPESVANFTSYIDDGFFDGTIFHRIVD